MLPFRVSKSCSVSARSAPPNPQPSVTHLHPKPRPRHTPPGCSALLRRGPLGRRRGCICKGQCIGRTLIGPLTFPTPPSGNSQRTRKGGGGGGEIRPRAIKLMKEGKGRKRRAEVSSRERLSLIGREEIGAKTHRIGLRTHFRGPVSSSGTRWTVNQTENYSCPARRRARQPTATDPEKSDESTSLRPMEGKFQRVPGGSLDRGAGPCRKGCENHRGTSSECKAWRSEHRNRRTH